LRVFEETRDKNYAYKQIVEHSIEELLILIQRKMLNSDGEVSVNTYKDAVISELLEDIQINFASINSIDELAKKYHISKSYLEHSFKDTVGEPIMKYIAALKIHEAEYQLATTDNTLETIASALGYCSQFYFSRIFKKNIGVCPREYRKNTYGKQDKK
jgi:AraC-like DNA-binding protein